MKRALLKLFLVVSDVWYRLQFRLVVWRIDKQRHVYLVDIDNTLADTWPTLNPRQHRSERERMASLAIFMGMRRYILDLLGDRRNKVIFLTARNILAHPVTFEWLKRNKIDVAFTDVIVVSSASEKLRYIKLIRNKKYKMTYIDDLSYNHEYGDMKFYERVIAEVDGLGIVYLGLKDINRINTGSN